MSYDQHFNTRQTSQNQPIPGSAQVRNSAGGFSFAIDDWSRLRRFLILGSEGGSYYASEQKLTRNNAEAVVRCIQADGLRVVREIVDVSTSGRAPKNDPALFALAMCMKLSTDPLTKNAANAALSAVARIGTDLFHHAKYVKAFGGWGSGTCRAYARWYTGKPLTKMVYQMVKYQSRDGVSHRDTLRLAHVPSPSPAHELAYAWAGRWDAPTELQREEHAPSFLRKEVRARLDDLKDGIAIPEGLELIAAFEAAKRATSVKEVAKLVREHRLTHEMVPTEFLSSREVWAELLPHMKPWALVRNLGRLTSNGLVHPMSQASRLICDKLADKENLREEKLHPIKVLTALLQYRAGRGNRGDLVWSPDANVVDALDAAFYTTFGLIEPAGKRTCLSLDVSTSMEGGSVAGVRGLTPRIASAAMALVTAAVEKEHVFLAFTSGSPGEWVPNRGGFGITKLTISPRMRLDDVCEEVAKLDMGGTDCALPILWALHEKVPVDTFCTYTDNESWAGDIHAAQALKTYRDKMGIPAKLVAVGMTATEYSIADPNDGGMLDVVGFDTAAPELISSFSAGRL